MQPFLAAGPPLRLLPLAIDDWDTGHELPDVVDGHIFSAHVFVRVENHGSDGPGS